MAEFAALGAAAVLAVMFFAERLPPSPDFLLPRRGGFALYQAFWTLFASHAGRTAFSVVITLLLLAAAAGFAWELSRSSPKKLPTSWHGWGELAVGPVLAVVLCARVWIRILDLVQLVWFPYGGMDVREPLVVFALGACALGPAAAGACAWVGRRRTRATTLFGILLALDVGGAWFGQAKGIGASIGAAMDSGKTLYVVLTQNTAGASSEQYVLSPNIFKGPDPRPALRAVASGSYNAIVLPALRRLYDEETKHWDLDGLRTALLLGTSRGDILAPSILLAHLTAAAPSHDALVALAQLDDENEWRIGPMGAAELARAYAHQGDLAAAARWAQRAEGAHGVAAGLLAANAGRVLRTGRISGVLRAPKPTHIALYLRTDPEAPYLLDAAGLVAATDPDAKGRFSFSKLTPGRYYLAFALSLPNIDMRRRVIAATVEGGQGDVIIDRKHPSVALRPLTIVLR